jgi:hypothetical protein
VAAACGTDGLVRHGGLRPGVKRVRARGGAPASRPGGSRRTGSLTEPGPVPLTGLGARPLWSRCPRRRCGWRGSPGATHVVQQRWAVGDGAAARSGWVIRPGPRPEPGIGARAEPGLRPAAGPSIRPRPGPAAKARIRPGTGIRPGAEPWLGVPGPPGARR